MERGIIRIAMIIVFDGSLAPLHTRRLRALPSRSQKPNREAASRGGGVTTTIGGRVESVLVGDGPSERGEMISSMYISDYCYCCCS